MKHSLKLVAVHVVLTFLCFVRGTNAETERIASDREVQQAKKLLGDVLTCAEKLTRGDAELKITGSRPATVAYVFDFSVPAMHVETTEVGARVRTVKYVRNGKDAWVCIRESGLIEHLAGGTRHPVAAAQPFDVRAIGLIGSGRFERRRSFDEMNQELRSLQTEGFVEDKANDKLIGIALTSPVRQERDNLGAAKVTQSRYVYWVNSDRGNTVEKVETFLRISSKPKSRSWDSEQLREVVSTRWEEVDDIFVPVESAMSGLGDDGKLNVHTTLDLKWNSVNKAADPSRFTVESLAAEPGTRIVEPPLVPARE